MPSEDSNTCASKQSDQSLCCPHEETWLVIQTVPSEDSDKNADAQTDLNLRLDRISEGTFSHIEDLLGPGVQSFVSLTVNDKLVNCCSLGICKYIDIFAAKM